MMDRRKFIESAGRWGIVGILAAITSILVRRNAITLENECDPKFCSTCSKKATCHPGLDPGSQGISTMRKDRS